MTSAESTARVSPALVEVLEQLVAGQVAHAPHDRRELAVAQRDSVLHAALAAEAEPHRRAVHAHLARAQRGEAEGVVGARVLLVADADARGLEQAHDGGEHLVARQAGEREVLADAAADARQRLAKASMRPYLVSSRTSRQRG